jgi:DNA uptake protein ComE-like DNA-binding protein
LIFRFSIFARTNVITFIGVAVLWTLAVNVSARGGPKEWIILKDCRLIPNKANDGDSFHIWANNTEYLIRLYFVDAPETASVGPARLIEQAEYFGVSVPQVIEIGVEAKKFVDAKLSEPFIVVTRLAEGLGRSKIQRIYGLVRTKDGDLGEQLIANGLARIHGVHPAMPEGPSGEDEIQRLGQLEQGARQKKLGAWALSAQPLKGPGATPQPLADVSHSISATPVPLMATGSAIEVKKSQAKAVPELGRIDVNTATEKELRMIPGIGPVIAARIIAARPFRSADDLKRVSGIGDKKYAQIRPYFQ